ncbi:hypothetical protein T01_9136 [Trichinella spiralis]|uniref:Uncharacterized protein n=1 Tax=Trichinella spiralis TaxID=6334 RepID=A0A0V1B517_TRISP|nr:hypothetical protein T01_9136 [Trichinella spiralis]
MEIRNHVDKYVITKHYHQLMPLSLATCNLLSEWTFFYIHINEYESIRFNKLTVYELTLFYVVNVKQPDSED